LVADRADQPADRRAAVHLAADRADPPGVRVRQARHRLRARLAPRSPATTCRSRPAPVAPPQDSALPGELPRGGICPALSAPPQQAAEKQRFTAQPGPVRRRRDPPDGGCLMLPGAAQ
jgi:hypothetical protein